MKKVSIITLGCAKNVNDTENLTGLLNKEKIQVENDLSKADAVVVHTCSFIEAAKKESVETILDASKVKKKKAKLFVTGCMVQQHGKEMMEEIPEADAFLGTGQLSQVPLLLKKPKKRFLDRRNPGGLTDPDAARVLFKKGASANLRLSEGCSHPCSFCVIPKLRGGLQSRPEKTILKEARDLVDSGIRELVIIGQDTGDWGRDIYGERRLHSLLRKIREIPGLTWVRLMYMHPFSMTDNLIHVMAESPEFFPYLDMPLQHIDNNMLMTMERRLPEKKVRRLLDKIHTKLPDISLRTTFIVGYPGETDSQFTKLNNFINEGHFDYLGAFPYSKEENTPAGIMKNQLSDSLKQERHAALMATHFNVAYQKAQKRIGKKEMVLIEETEGDTVVGRSRKEAPEIDAVIRLPKKAARYGNFVEAELTSYDSYEFEGQPTQSSPVLVYA